MIDEIKGLVKGGGTCVMATIAGDRPYTSLMRYSCNDNCTEIYLVTHRNTTKYENLRKNSHASLMMDTRENGDLSKVRALSVDGRYMPFKDYVRHDKAREQFLVWHPDLKSFAHHPDAEVLRIVIKSFLLLKGLNEAHRIRVAS